MVRRRYVEGTERPKPGEIMVSGSVRPQIVVCCTGYFDPLHPGHLSHFKAARALGDKLVVITHPDERCIAKKGFCYQPLAERIKALYGTGLVDEVVVSIDTDGTVAQTLRLIHPQVYAKGGDRSPDQHPIPQSEIDACNEISCQIVYNVGEAKRPEWSSTRIGRKALGLDGGGL